MPNELSSWVGGQGLNPTSGLTLLLSPISCSIRCLFPFDLQKKKKEKKITWNLFHNYESKTVTWKPFSWCTQTKPHRNFPWIHWNPGQLTLKLNSAGNQNSGSREKRLVNVILPEWKSEWKRNVINRLLCTDNEGPGRSWTKALLCNRRQKTVLTLNSFWNFMKLRKTNSWQEKPKIKLYHLWTVSTCITLFYTMVWLNTGFRLAAGCLLKSVVGHL